LGYSRQTTDTNTSLGDLPSGASARDDTKEQLKMYRAKGTCNSYSITSLSSRATGCIIGGGGMRYPQ